MREWKHEKTKRSFANALIELGTTAPIGDIMVQNIADRCELSKRAFYNHFRDKYDLITWIFADASRSRMMTADSWDSFVEQLGSCLANYQEFGAYYDNALVNTSGFDSFEKGMQRTMMEVLRDVGLKLSGRDELDDEAAFYLRYFVYGITCTAMDWYVEGTPRNPQELAVHFVEGMPEALKPWFGWTGDQLDSDKAQGATATSWTRLS